MIVFAVSPRSPGRDAVHVTESPEREREVVRVVLPPVARSAKSARTVMGDVAAVYGLSADTLRMVASELVANAVEHAGTGGYVELVVSMNPDCVFVEVVDREPGLVPDLDPTALMPTDDATAERGRGLMLLTALYEARLEVHVLGDGTSKAVSATLDRSGLLESA
jgi:anti-sigma regulatory factor (Ser/Thr protein kinase)